MSQDINYIKSKIRDCEEVTSPFDLRKGNIVRYITIEGDSEFFYDGGEYIGMGDNIVRIKEGGKRKDIPITIINNLGKILYKSRFFVVTGECTTYNDNEYKKIIRNQQRIIEVLIQKNGELEKKIKDN